MYINVIRYGAYMVVDIKVDAFIHHMARSTVGSLMKAGVGNQLESRMVELSATKGRTFVVVTVKTKGLHLMSVDHLVRYDLPVLPMGPLPLAD